MRSLLLFLVALSASAEPLCFTGARWFDGTAFRARTVCTSNGVLTSKRPRNARNIELAGAFVVPPFGEAHNHNVEASERLDGVIRTYLDAGVFYVKNPNSLPRATPRDRVNRPDSIDAVFSLGGLTGTGGHPVDLLKRNVDRGAWTAADGDGAFFHIIDSLADLDAKLPRLLAQKPDFIKTYLLFSEEYHERKNDASKGSWRGLNPEHLPEIVRRAHAAGLRVSTHVETARDFHWAVHARTDEINHLPGFRADVRDDRFFIRAADAMLAARYGITVVTTSGGGLRQLPASRDAIAANLKLLRRHGVKLAIGSDDYRNGVVPEVTALRELGIFSDAELLVLWSRATPRAIFPKRKIGCLDDGCEASFLALEGDPLTDFANTGRIRLRVKDGALLELAPKP
jgi:hypothetical protein